MLTPGEVIERSDELRMQHSLMDRRRIRAIMNGGAEGVQAVLGWGLEGPEVPVDELDVDLPTANVLWSGLERLAQKIGRPPTLKTDMIPTKDSSAARKRAEKRQRIVTGWDDMGRLEMQFPQIGRWLPGYGFTLHVIKERDMGGYTYPIAELRDPYDVYPGWWGPDQQPAEVVSVRRVPHAGLKRRFPELSDVPSQVRRGGIPIIGQGGWESGGQSTQDVEVIEYIDTSGTYLICTDTQQSIAHIPNPLSSGAPFVMTKRFGFDRLNGQYTHVFGLMAQMAKLNILGMMAAEDSNFRETNVFGDMDSEEYLRGREAVNHFQPGARVEKPTGDIINQTWQAVNILERQFRIVAGYDVQQDGASPNSFATGAGMQQLQSAADNNVREYQTAIRHSVELIDRKRLEWDEVMHPNRERKVYWYEGSKQNEETYTPAKDIAGDYRTRRVYGAMATFDETQKLLAGLQLLGAGVIDVRTLRENLDGLDNESLIEERLVADAAKDALLGSLGARSQQMDPTADMALIEILEQPSGAVATLKKFFTPQEPAMSPEEAMMAQMGGGGGMPPGAGPGMETAPPIQTVLAQMEAEGGGAQTVAVS